MGSISLIICVAILKAKLGRAPTKEEILEWMAHHEFMRSYERN